MIEMQGSTGTASGGMYSTTYSSWHVPNIEDLRTNGGHKVNAGGVNVSGAERSVSVAAGALAAFVGLRRGTLPGLLVAGLGSALLYRGITGHCEICEKLGIDRTRRVGVRGSGSSEREITEAGFRVEQSFLINRSAEDLYRAWRDFERLPRIMTHLESVKVLDERRSHWVIPSPTIPGRKLEWDSEITTDEPNHLIAWRSLPGADVENLGQVSFERAAADRGTTVRVSIAYIPPAGRIGNSLAALLGKSPARQVREDLRNFKRVMELGEAPTTTGQPHGTCVGRTGLVAKLVGG